MSRSRSAQPAYIHDIIIKSDEMIQAETPEVKTTHLFSRFSWTSKQPAQPGAPKKLSARARVKRQAELTDLYQRFRKHPNYDDYNGM